MQKAISYKVAIFFKKKSLLRLLHGLHHRAQTKPFYITFTQAIGDDENGSYHSFDFGIDHEPIKLVEMAFPPVIASCHQDTYVRYSTVVRVSIYIKKWISLIA